MSRGGGTIRVFGFPCLDSICFAIDEASPHSTGIPSTRTWLLHRSAISPCVREQHRNKSRSESTPGRVQDGYDFEFIRASKCFPTSTRYPPTPLKGNAASRSTIRMNGSRVSANGTLFATTSHSGED
ncbi:MAG: hypothetical protein EZS28_034489 [Streblomastix strix]|uniref:Uncharacterized protein n=1 Tax=Streblomastix strix TaxID=222440 RepID=A0A5J4UIH5_9EUKA|nr:MAG: hypothetical protein EZS28_034489 [Streblomastix strix]